MNRKVGWLNKTESERVNASVLWTAVVTQSSNAANLSVTAPDDGKELRACRLSIRHAA